MSESSPSTPRVLFLALGATRKLAVTRECEQALRVGAATVVVDSVNGWPAGSFVPGVRVVELAQVTRGHLPMRAERAVLYAAPRILFSAFARVGARRQVDRLARAYRTRVADRIHRRLFMPTYRLLWPGTPCRMLDRHIGVPGYTHLVMSDPDSFPLAARLARRLSRTDARMPVMSFAFTDVAITSRDVTSSDSSSEDGVR